MPRGRAAREAALAWPSTIGSTFASRALGRREPQAAPAAARPAIVEVVALLVLYVGLEWLSFLHEHDGLPVTPWNPGLGIMFATIIVKGASYGGVFFVGVLLAEILILRSALPLPTIIAIGAILAASYTAVGLVARACLGSPAQLLRTRDVLVLSASGLAGAVMSSMLLGLLLFTFNYFDLSDIARTAAPLVVGDVIGIAVVTPICMRVLQAGSGWRASAPATLIEFSLYTVVVVGILSFTMWPGGNRQSHFYLLFLPTVVAAVRHGIDGACAALAIAQLVLIAMLHFFGFDLTRFTEYQVLMLVLTLTGLVVGTLVSEKHVADDTTRRTELRLQEMRAEAARVARLNLVSGMAAAIAHEINQPMTAARALARSAQHLLRSPEGDGARAEKNVASMIEQIDHAAAVVRRMREFLRRGEPHLSTVDLGSVLRDAIALVEPWATARQVRVALNVPADAPDVFADRVQVQQVIINLVKNAVEAITESRRSDGLVVVKARHLEAARAVEIMVQDNGRGIDGDKVASLFEPLSTSSSDGIGLGLSICKSIVEAHNGQIWLAASAPGRTEFRFTLPAAGSGEEGHSGRA